MSSYTCSNPLCDSVDADKKCSKCHIAFYCTKECQVADWKIHKKSCKPCKCIEIPGKGLGMVATRDISYGELIIQERPTITIIGYKSDAAIMRQFNQLPDEDQKKVMSLHDKEAPKTPPGIIKTNSLQAGAGSLDSVLCCEISRFNHSCLPNVYHAFAEPYERVYAIRDIKKGTELCTAYITPENSTSKRRESLENKFGFICTCPVCALPKEEQIVRDRKLRRYLSLDQKIGSINRKNARQGLAWVEEALDILKEVDLICPALIGRHCYDGFQLACMLADERKAKQLMKRAHEARLIENGPDHKIVKDYEIYLKNPRLHRTWQSI